MPPKIDDLARHAMQFGAQARDRMRALLDRHHDAVTLFYDKGKMKPAAARFFARLAAENYIDKSTFHADPREHAKREGRRDLMLDLMALARLDSSKIEAMKKQMMEDDDHE